MNYSQFELRHIRYDLRDKSRLGSITTILSSYVIITVLVHNLRTIFVVFLFFILTEIYQAFNIYCITLAPPAWEHWVITFITLILILYYFILLYPPPIKELNLGKK